LRRSYRLTAWLDPRPHGDAGWPRHGDDDCVDLVLLRGRACSACDGALLLAATMSPPRCCGEAIQIKREPPPVRGRALRQAYSSRLRYVILYPARSGSRGGVPHPHCRVRVGFYATTMITSKQFL